MSAEMITLFVPTIDRPEFLERLLRYYATVGYTGRIAVGDSSRDDLASANAAAIRRYGGSLRILYERCPGMSSCETMEALSRRAATPYCAFVADDDFLCPDGLARAVAFLSSHPDHVAAHGNALILQVAGGGATGAVGAIAAYPQTVLHESTGVGRLREFLNHNLYALLYSVHRTEAWRDMFLGLGRLKGMRNHNVFKDELIATSVSVIRGKVADVGGLYLVRQAHAGIYRFPHPYDWFIDPDWTPSYRTFADRVTEELARVDGMDAEAAAAVVRSVFWPYLARAVTTAWSAEQGPTRRRSTPPSLMRRVLAKAQALVRRRRPSLRSLLDPRSPAHAAFLPIYRAITQPPQDAPLTIDAGTISDAAQPAGAAGR